MWVQLGRGLKTGHGTFTLYKPESPKEHLFKSMSIDGEFKNNHIIKGKLLIDSKVAFDGDFTHGEANFIFEDYSIHIKNSQLDYGVKRYDGSTRMLDASFVAGYFQNGYIKYKDDPEIDSYDGSFDKGQKLKGKITFKNGDKYIGTLNNGNFSEGTYIWKDGSSVVAEWGSRDANKIKKYTNKEGHIYEPDSSQRLDCLQIGPLSDTSKCMKVSFKGSFGKVTIADKEKTVYEGFWMKENDATTGTLLWFFTGVITIGRTVVKAEKSSWFLF